MTDTKRLKELIHESGYRQGFIASKCGIAMPTLTAKIHNKNEFKQSEIKIISDLLGLDDKTRNEIFFAE